MNETQSLNCVLIFSQKFVVIQTGRSFVNDGDALYRKLFIGAKHLGCFIGNSVTIQVLKEIFKIFLQKGDDVNFHLIAIVSNGSGQFGFFYNCVIVGHLSNGIVIV
jgi:hypothetical protein